MADVVDLLIWMVVGAAFWFAAVGIVVAIGAGWLWLGDRRGPRHSHYVCANCGRRVSRFPASRDNDVYFLHEDGSRVCWPDGVDVVDRHSVYIVEGR